MVFCSRYGNLVLNIACCRCSLCPKWLGLLGNMEHTSTSVWSFHLAKPYFSGVYGIINWCNIPWTILNALNEREYTPPNSQCVTLYHFVSQPRLYTSNITKAFVFKKNDK
jgi:hypothetical protein